MGGESGIFNVLLHESSQRTFPSVLTAYSDLADVQCWPPSLTHIFVTCTSTPNSIQPPNLLSIRGVWQQKGLEDVKSTVVGDASNVRKVITVQVGRPCRLSCDPGILLEGCVGAVTALLDSKEEASDKGICTHASGETTSDSHAETSYRGDGAKEGGVTRPGCLEPSRVSDGGSIEVQFSMVQVTLELFIPTAEHSPGKLVPIPTHSPVPPSRAHSDGQGPGELQRPLILSWESLDCSFNGREGRAVCTRVQVFSLGEAGRQYIALPTTVECVLTRHLPTSSLDR